MADARAGTPSNQVENLPYDEREEDYQEFEEYDEVTKPANRPFYKRRKYWIFCAIMTVIIVAVAVPIGLFVILPKVAQTILNNSNMAFNSIQITNPTNTSMSMSMNGALSNTGPFSANIKFPEPIEVYYGETLLGNMRLPDAKASGGHGDLIADATFNIADEAAFGSFSADMVSPLSLHSLLSTVFQPIQSTYSSLLPFHSLLLLFLPPLTPYAIHSFSLDHSQFPSIVPFPLARSLSTLIVAPHHHQPSPAIISMHNCNTFYISPCIPSSFVFHYVIPAKHP
jgi:hypothetical protein